MGGMDCCLAPARGHSLLFGHTGTGAQRSQRPSDALPVQASMIHIAFEQRQG